MTWVSTSKLTGIMNALRNKFVTSDLVIADSSKANGVELNYAAQDGLVTVSPISTSASVESALHLSNGDDSKKTELTQGTLSYVTGSGDSEKYNYMSLLGDTVTFGKNGGGNVQVGGVADPTSDQQVATKYYVDNAYIVERGAYSIAGDLKVPSNGFARRLETTAEEISGYRLINAYFIPYTYIPDISYVASCGGYYNGSCVICAIAFNTNTSADVTIPSGATFTRVLVYKRSN